LEPARQIIWLLAVQACDAMQGYGKIEASKVKRGEEREYHKMITLVLSTFQKPWKQCRAI
jgi:hypothetical protein